MDASTGRRICTREMVVEAVVDCRERGIVSRIDGVTPPSHEISAFIRKTYDLNPSASTVLRLRNEVMAELQQATSAPSRQQQPAVLRPEIEQLLDRAVQQTQASIGELARMLAGIQKNTDDEFARRLNQSIEHNNQEAQQQTALMTEELESAYQRINDLEDRLNNMSRQLDATRAEAATERARAATFEQVNTALLVQFSVASVSIHADQPAAAVQQSQTVEQPTQPTTDQSGAGTPIAGEQTAVKSSRRGRPRVTTPIIEQEAA
ncbi:hypothetical protein SAMN02745119_01508 [Trichlorobacter thiogenes]|uniref:Uncharacterized protein n=1 Tax=Trichlorobacter thiogenes TaxID=115783 RepID=A0A1T4N3I1_9BACT|nr:hypothetical protein [Trichlorobacter thiogenes]SJZ73869.1 hypothetical protein SAMN02745119_01508 [Trichlorobacter thiogenes]